MYRLVLNYGKYEIIMSKDMSTFEALRYSEPWRNLVGDNLILALVQRIQDLEEQEER